MNMYAVLLGLGASVGCWEVIRTVCPRERARWSTYLLLILLGALIGSRSWFVLQMAFYSGQTTPFFSIWQGGLNWPGAVLGGLLVMVAFILIWHLPPALTFDRMLPLFVLLPVTAWLGCWQMGCAYGQSLPSDSFWSLLILDEAGTLSERFPLQFLAVLLLLGLVLLLVFLQRRHLFLPGQLAAATGAGLSLDLLLVAFLRADLQPRWQGLPVEAWAALVLLLVCVAAWFWAGWAARPEW